MNLIKIEFDDGTELAVKCDCAKVSKQGVLIVGGELNDTFHDDAHGAELIAMGASEEKEELQ
jgi:hypothetical protein